MGLLDIDNEKFRLILEFFVELFDGAKLAPERGSGITAKDKNDRFLPFEAGKLHFGAAVHALELEIRRGIANAERVSHSLRKGRKGG